MPLAIEHIRRMRGGAQSHLMRCEDENYYVVKFQNNPNQFIVRLFDEQKITIVPLPQVEMFAESLRPRL